MAIPKIIHQVILDRCDFHARFAENISSLRSLNPGWEHRLYEESDIVAFISEHYGQDTLKYYEKINPTYGAAKVDLFRYLALYKFGGVYLDIKSTAKRPFDEVFSYDDEYILSHWSNEKGHPYEGWGRRLASLGVDDEYQQWHIVAAPKHPFLEAVILRVKNNIDIYNPVRDRVGKLGVLKLTGPIPYTLAILSVQQYGRFRLVNIEDLGFLYSIFGPSGNHEVYFRNHYRNSVEPIVRPDNYHERKQYAEKKIRRNELCPCGSQKRYKHCHGILV